MVSSRKSFSHKDKTYNKKGYKGKGSPNEDDAYSVFGDVGMDGNI